LAVFLTFFPQVFQARPRVDPELLAATLPIAQLLPVRATAISHFFYTNFLIFYEPCIICIVFVKKKSRFWGVFHRKKSIFGADKTKQKKKKKNLGMRLFFLYMTGGSFFDHFIWRLG
jgi:hypothetical protein